MNFARELFLDEFFESQCFYSYRFVSIVFSNQRHQLAYILYRLMKSSCRSTVSHNLKLDFFFVLFFLHLIIHLPERCNFIKHHTHKHCTKKYTQLKQITFENAFPFHFSVVFFCYFSHFLVLCSV